METNPNSRIKDIVLARAHRIYFFRPLFSRGAAAFLVLGASLFILAREVWVAKVIQNMPSPTHTGAVLRFFEAAFLNTGFLVQAVVVISIGAGIWLARECARSLFPARQYA